MQDAEFIALEEDDNYFSIFNAAGWTHVCSVGNCFHYFPAAPGTRSIYTDKDTLSEKYKIGTMYVFKAIAVIVPVLAGSILLKWALRKHFSTSIPGLIASMVIGSSIGILFAITITGIILKTKAKSLRSSNKRNKRTVPLFHL